MSRSSHQLTNEIDRPEPVVSAYELGQTIREMRIALQRDINDVAADLRIKVGYLKAIEDGRFRDLPGPAYATGFVRAYADYLGADSAEVVRLYKEAIGGGESRTALVLPSPVEEGRLPTGSVLLVAGILAIGAYGGWYYLSLKGQDPLDVVANVPDRVTKAIRGEQGERGATPVISASIDLRRSNRPSSGVTSVATGPSSVGETDEAPSGASLPISVVPRTAPGVAEAPPPQADTAGNETNAPAPSEVAAAPDEMPPAAEPAEAAPKTETTELAARRSPPPPPPAPEIEPVDMADLPSIGKAPAIPARRAPVSEPPRAEAPPPMAGAPEAVAVAGPPIVLRADSPSWVEVRDGRDQPVYSGLLRAGETVNLPRLRGLTLNTGNAGGLQITIDGRTMPSLGPRGAVRRNISLDLESLSSARR